MLPPPYGTGQYANPARPTDAELLQSQIGVIYMPGADGGHSSMPYYGIKVKQFANFTSNNVRDILAVSSEETDNRCTGSPHLLYLMDITATIGQGGSTSAEQHPWPISTVTVDDFSGRPNFCSRGTRFGVHSMAENFNDPYYGRLMTSAWFDAGIRVTDIRDPYHPVEVAHVEVVVRERDHVVMRGNLVEERPPEAAARAGDDQLHRDTSAGRWSRNHATVSASASSNGTSGAHPRPRSLSHSSE